MLAREAPDDGELGGDEQAVGQHEQQDDAERDGEPVTARPPIGRRREARRQHRLRRRGRRLARPRTRTRRLSRGRPAAGSRPSAAVTSPPTVAASVSSDIVEQRRGVVHGHAAREPNASVRQRFGDRLRPA